MTVKTASPARTMFGVVASAAFAAITMFFCASAVAADHHLGPNDIAGYVDCNEGTTGYNYDQWHIGSVVQPDALSTDSLEFGECNVTVLDVPEGEGTASITQVFKGYEIGNRPTDPEDIEAVILSTMLEYEGDATLQFPFFE